MKRTSPLLAVFLTVTVDLLGFGLIMPLLPRYGTDFGASKPLVGLLFASYSAMQFLFAPLWGRLSDRAGRRPVILVGLGGSVASYALFALAVFLPHGAQLPVVFASRATAGAFGGTISTAYAYVADVTAAAERGRGMALIGAAFGIGFTLGPAVGALGWTLHPSAPGWIAAGLSATAFLFALLRLPEPEQHRETARAWFDSTALRRALATAGVPGIFALTFLAHACFALFESTLALFLEDRFAFDPENYLWLFSYLGLSAAFAQGVLVRRLVRPVGEGRLVVLGSLTLGLGLLLVGHAPSLGLLLVALPLPVFGFAMMNPSLSSLLSRRTAPTVQGGTLGLNQSFASLARIAGPVTGTSLLAVGLTWPHWAGAAAMVLAFAASLRLARTRVADRS